MSSSSYLPNFEPLLKAISCRVPMVTPVSISISASASSLLSLLINTLALTAVIRVQRKVFVRYSQTIKSMQSCQGATGTFRKMKHRSWRNPFSSETGWGVPLLLPDNLRLLPLYLSACCLGHADTREPLKRAYSFDHCTSAPPYRAARQSLSTIARATSSSQPCSFQETDLEIHTFVG